MKETAWEIKESDDEFLDLWNKVPPFGGDDYRAVMEENRMYEKCRAKWL